MKRAQDESSEAVDSAPPSKRVCLLRPRVPEAPEGASPLYGMLVPHGSPVVPFDMAMATSAVCLEEIGDNDRFYWLTSPTGYRRLQRALAVLQFARTCRHAAYHINVKPLLNALFRGAQCSLDSEVGSGWRQVLPQTIFKSLVAAMDAPVHQWKYFDLHCVPNNSLARWALMAAVLGSGSVAHWYAPPGLQLDTDWFRDWAPVSSSLRGPADSAQRELLFLPVAEDARLKMPAWQHRMWLSVALRLKRPHVARCALYWAGRDQRLMAALRIFCEFATSTPVALFAARHIAISTYGTLSAKERRKKIDVALATFDARLPGAWWDDDYVCASYPPLTTLVATDMGLPAAEPISLSSDSDLSHDPPSWSEGPPSWAIDEDEHVT